MLSCKLILNFDKQNQLFKDKIKTDYKITVFICKCGFNKFIISKQNQYPDYKCKVCQNNYYWKINNKTYNKFKLQYELLQSRNKIIAISYINIPYSIDLASQNIKYKKRVISSITFKSNGNIKYSKNYILKNKVDGILKELLIEELKNRYYKVCQFNI